MELLANRPYDKHSGNFRGRYGAAKLVRTGIVAGARAVIAPFSAPDQNVSIASMSEFYRGLTNGTGVADEQRDARLHMPKLFGSLPNPKLWSKVCATSPRFDSFPEHGARRSAHWPVQPSSQKLPSTSQQKPGTRILWIDDEVNVKDAAIKLLALQGIDIECAGSGAAGGRLARIGHFAGIILDLRLPDTDGLLILEQLHIDRVRTPVLVLTGFGDVRTAVKAMKLGAVDFREKPLWGEDLVSAVRSMILHEDVHIQGPDRNQSRLLHYRLLEDSPSHVFILLTSAFRSAVVSCDLSASWLEAKMAILDAFKRRIVHEDEHVPAVLVKALDHLQWGLQRSVLPSELELAAGLQLASSEVGRLLGAHLGLRFPEARRTLRLRPSLRGLALSTEHVSQIAYSIRYEHVGQFDRDFRMSFGLTPREFRRLFREG